MSSATPTYEIVNKSLGLHGWAKGITCLVCGMTSFNPNDVRELYCGYCHRFHEKAETTETP